MTTLNPRVNVTLSPSLDALVTQLAGFERISKSMVLRELLEAAEPALRQAIALMEAAKGATATARKNLAMDLDAGIKAGEGTSHITRGIWSLKLSRYGGAGHHGAKRSCPWWPRERSAP